MTPRIRALLRAPYMVGVAQLPGIVDVTADELEALEPFVAFCAQHRVTTPKAADLRAFLALSSPSGPADSTKDAVHDTLARLAALERVLYKLDFGAALITAVRTAREEVRHRGFFRGYNHGIRRNYARTVSLPVADLPTNWQTTLRDLRRKQVYSLSVLDRMERRLGMFAWSAERAGRPVDLEDPEAECALYDDLIDRSRAKAIRGGEDPATAQPRWAYLRSTAEELRRFAKHLGVSDATRERLDRNYRGFTGLEQRQTPLKMFAALQAPDLPVTLAKARIELEEAQAVPNAAHRHQRRMKACARGITVACPPRARDVVDRMFWGKGVFYRSETNSYAFKYEQSKTGSKLDIGFEPSFNVFFDALLLGDNDRRYLPALRDRAIAQHRPLFLRYDGDPVAYGWFGRTWDEAIGSSGQLARTLLQTFLADLGEVGLDYGRRAIGHRSHRALEKYRDEHARQISARRAGNAFSDRAKALSPDDITDLL